MTRLPFAAKQDPVEYLVRKRHPSGCFRDSAVDSTPLTPATRAAIEAADAFRTELRTLSKEELQALVDEARAAEAERNRIAAEEAERAFAFNRPEAEADFKYWASMSYWTIDEAVALSFGRNPKVANWDAMKPYIRISPFVQRFIEKREVALRAKAMGQLWERTIPSVFVAWTQRMSFEFPQELVAEITLLGIQIADWKTICDQQKEIAENARKEVDDERKARLAEMQERKNYLDEMMERHRGVVQSYGEIQKAKDQHIALLSNAVEGLKQEMRVREKAPAPAKDETIVGTRERESMVKLIIGMAVAGYSYNHKAARSVVPAEIEADLARVGVGLDDYTIRKYLREGAEHLPGNQDD